jgi:hypothetical protein
MLLKLLQWVRLATIPFALAQFVCAAEPQYNPDVGAWQAVAVPPISDYTASEAWEHAANYSPYDWSVFIKDSRVCANTEYKTTADRIKGLGFTPRAEGLKEVSAIAPVSDGYLVGFNEGEWGAALYWFARDGKCCYKVSARIIHHLDNASTVARAGGNGRGEAALPLTPRSTSGPT